jgi:hypothetical protein
MTVDDIKALNTSGTWNNNAYSINGGTLTLMTDNSGNVIGININGTFNDSTTFHLINSNSVVFPNNQYILNGISGGSASTYRYLYLSPSSGYLYSDGGDTLLNLDEGVSKIRLLINSGYNAQNVKVYPMIRLATESDSTFAPYSNICPISGQTEANVVVSPTTSAEDGTTYNIQFKDGDNPLTVYGGTFDVVSGVLTVDRAYVDLGTLNWTYYNYSNVNGFYSSDLTNAKRPTSSSVKSNLISDRYKTVADSDFNTNGKDMEIAISASGALYLKVKNNAYIDATAFKTAMNGAQVVYELATPQTYQLTPTIIKSLQGENNFFADSGEIELLQYFGKETA